MGYEWLMVHDPDFEDLVTTVHLIGSELKARGFGPQLLAAAFPFEGGKHRSTGSTATSAAPSGRSSRRARAGARQRRGARAEGEARAGAADRAGPDPLARALRRAALSHGWFVTNVRDARWVRHETFGASALFDDPEARFEEWINVRVLQPGQPASLFHAESAQEGFLVLQGRCILVVEGEERALEAWDFVHCPPLTKHVFARAGEEPRVIDGLRPQSGLDVVYPVDEAAARLGACAEHETHDPAKATGRTAVPSRGSRTAGTRFPGPRLTFPDMSGV